MISQAQAGYDGFVYRRLFNDFQEAARTPEFSIESWHKPPPPVSTSETVSLESLTVFLGAKYSPEDNRIKPGSLREATVSILECLGHRTGP